jgi:hypothetical protein
LPTDELWAAKQVVRFTDEEIRAVVETGMYSDPRAVDWITKCLIERRNKIGRTFLAKVLPLDNFRIESGRLAFDDIAAMYNYAQQRKYTVRWSTFDNDSEQKADIAGHAGFEVPDSEAAYLVADINAGDAKTVAVYVRNSPGRTQVVGVERTWEPSDEDRRRGLDAIRNDRAALR